MSRSGLLSRRLEWMQLGTSLFVESMSGLEDSELDAASRLPGWSRRHLLAHVGFNARALQRLVRWARTGERTPMYASPEQRAAEIEQGATWDPARLRTFVTETAAELEEDLDGLDDAAWQAEVVTAQGRTVRAEEIPWMRTREVAIHAVDLRSGVTFADLPDELCEAIIDDVCTRRSAQRKDPPVALHSTSGRIWSIDGAGSRVIITGTVQELARWLTGRGTGHLTTAEGGELPELTPWL